MDTLITPELIEEVLRHLDAQTCFKKHNISFEIQDDFQFLLLSISMDPFLGKDLPTSMKSVAHLLNKLMPQRKGNYSWMVNFKKNGEIVESYFGGDSDSPDSGL